jgi:hypothetical protein
MKDVQATILKRSVMDPWNFLMDPDPYLLLTDPAIFVNDLQDGNNKKVTMTKQ